jgi:hypothetical protein
MNRGLFYNLKFTQFYTKFEKYVIVWTFCHIRLFDCILLVGGGRNTYNILVGASYESLGTSAVCYNLQHGRPNGSGSEVTLQEATIGKSNVFNAKIY